MILTDTCTLSDGSTIPRLGLGTWMIDDDAVAQAVRDAVGIGYRHIDTAEGTATSVASARASGVADSPATNCS
jgi:diketogulonate reductase-like aldo/keto reductase